MRGKMIKREGSADFGGLSPSRVLSSDRSLAVEDRQTIPIRIDVSTTIEVCISHAPRDALQARIATLDGQVAHDEITRLIAQTALEAMPWTCLRHRTPRTAWRLSGRLGQVPATSFFTGVHVEWL